MNIMRSSIAMLLSLFLWKAQAAVDPVSWSLSPSTGFQSVNVGETTSVVYTLTINSKFPGPVVLRTQFNRVGGTFSTTDNCNNRSFNPGDRCQVIITFTPTDSTASSIQMSFQYNDNVIQLPTLQVTGTGVNSTVTATISNLPSQFTLSNPVQQPIFNVTYTNTGTTNITGYAGNAAGANLLSVSPDSVASVSVVAGQNFCGTSSSPVMITPGQSCTISGQLTPLAVGQLTVSGLFTYDNGTKTANAHGQSSVVNGTGPCQLSAQATLPFQNPTYRYADNVLQFTFTNHCTATDVDLGNVAYAASGTSSSPMITPTAGSFTTQYDNCSGRTLIASSSCTVLVSVIPQAAGTLTLTASVTGGGSTASAQTSTTVQTPGYNHTITFINQCPFPVWYGVSQPAGSSDPTPNPSPTAYFLAAQVSGVAPSTKSITIPGSYGGQFFPRTGCSLQGGNFVCATGDCGSGANAQCPSGNVYPPYTRVEETFTATTQGGYDVSLINGTSIPAELKGLGPFSSQVASPASPYVCTAAGAPIQPPYSFNPTYPPPPPPLPVLPPPATPLGNCAWNYTAPAPSSFLYNFVSNARTVTDCNSCTATETCGVAFQSTPAAGNIVLACGKLLGYWTINQLCSGNVTYVGANPAMNPSTVFNCMTPITTYSTQTYPVGTNAYSLYACVPNGGTLESCYNLSSGNATCCGAKDWNDNPYLTWQTQQSYAQNPDWVDGGTGAKPRLSPTPLASIQWLKDACPSAYAYPFDDHAGTFNCNTSDAAQQNQVKMDFEVVFCPGGLFSSLTQNP